MKVLMISGDTNVLKEGTAAHQRYLLQAAQVEQLSVLCRNPGESKLSAAMRMIKGGSKDKWDVVTAQDPFWLGAIARRIAKKTGATLQIQVHTDLAAQPLWKRMFARLQLRRADSIRVVSERIKKTLEPMRLRARITVLPVFIDKEAIRAAAPADLKTAFPQFEKIVLVASRLEPEKNVALAIESFREILRAVPKAGLIIAGGGSQLGSLQALAKKLGIEPQVIFLGQRSDIFSLYKSANVFLNTSRYEGFGASIVEALAAGCAVVSTDVGVAREAGATIASKKKEIGKKAAEILLSGTHGELKLLLPPALEWSQAWKDSL
jgi:glycosyltransferase involved in cell wall biosynthesis